MKKDNKDKSESRIDFKVLFIWIAIIGLLAYLLFGISNNSSVEQRTGNLTVSEMLKYAESNSISKLTIKADPIGGENYYICQGELKSTDGGKVSSFHTKGFLQGKDFDVLRKHIQADKFIENPASSYFGNLMGAILPSLIIGGIILFIIFRSIRSANKGQLSFGKSRAKLLDKEKSKVKFSDVAGIDECLEEVQEVVEFLKDSKKFQEIGGQVPKGVLLVGPPGTGKTLLARAVAGEADVPFFSISGSDFMELFVGIGAARVRDTFEQARKNAPCIVFIDEIDAVGRQRGSGLGGGNDEREQTLNSLLVEMDGFDAREGIIVIAATNRADVLDAALLRPGRFDRQVYVDLPDIKGRLEILAIHAKKFKINDKVDLKEVSKATTGFSGADLANLLNEAALIAVRAGKDKVDMLSLEEARDKISYGRERRRVMDEKDRTSTAYHEAGHALVQVLVDDGTVPLHKVTIIPRGGALGMAMFMPNKDLLGYTKTRLENMICTAMAGRIGEKVFTNDISTGASSDIKNATSLARQMVCKWGMSPVLGPIALGDNQQNLFLGREITKTQRFSEDTAKVIDDEISRILKTQYERAEKLISENADAHRKISEALLEYETLDGIHVKEIIEFGEVKTPIDYKPLSIKKELEVEKKELDKSSSSDEEQTDKEELVKENSELEEK